MKMQGKLIFILSAIIFSAVIAAAVVKKPAADLGEKAFQQFLRGYEAKVVPLSKEVALAAFQASISGSDEDFKRSADLQIQLNKVFADPAEFARLKAFKEGGQISEPLLKRQLDIIYDTYLENQIPVAQMEAMVKLQAQIEQKFNTFRARVNGNTLTDNDIEQILRTANDSRQLEAAWKGSKEIGRLVAPDILRLVKLRNKAAKQLGFANFREMQLKLSEQDPQAIESLFDELDLLTRDGFVALKKTIDAFLAARCGLNPEQLMPWHYQNRYFQEAPVIYPVDLDVYYKDRDLVRLTNDYFKGIGLPVDDIIARSDLFEKPGKYQHAFSSDIDRNGDARVLCSVKPDSYWMNTLLHEFGHSAYSKFNDPQLPWTLRDAAHAFTTEAIANLFGRFAASPAWLRDMSLIDAAEAQRVAAPSRDALRLQQMVFSRWAQVMFRFEKSMYENPDQDLNRRWWELVEKYQLLKMPAGRNEPDWAAKIHIALYPCYYHNYLLGELLASQLMVHIAGAILKSDDVEGQSFVGRPEVGRYLTEFVFKPGMRWPWNEMIERATGEKLTAKYYARQFVSGK
ncbi:MAG: M2 family metallopeptidase [Candidatus Aminicenantes bacterium]|nr:M2 family metallopeptidase [Candidatus Aminicenantes bacterium]